MKILVTGGTGFIGRHLVDHFVRNNAEVIVMSRSDQHHESGRVHYMTWEQLDEQSSEDGLLEGLDAIINLAGESIGQRWSRKTKDAIRQSRVEAARSIAQIINRLTSKPKVVINGSAIGIYGTSETAVYDETSPAHNEDFLADVVEDWEKAADEIKGVRLIKLRAGLVLGKDGGSLSQMQMPYRFGVGGRVGSGAQWLSWIHIDDMVQLIRYCIDHDDMSGPVNATAPHPVTNDQFGRALGKAMRRPHLFPVPAFMLKALFGEMSLLLLQGQHVIPRKLLEHGFEFSYPTVDAALQHIVERGN